MSSLTQSISIARIFHFRMSGIRCVFCIPIHLALLIWWFTILLNSFRLANYCLLCNYSYLVYPLGSLKSSPFQIPIHQLFSPRSQEYLALLKHPKLLMSFIFNHYGINNLQLDQGCPLRPLSILNCSHFCVVYYPKSYLRHLLIRVWMILHFVRHHKTPLVNGLLGSF